MKKRAAWKWAGPLAAAEGPVAVPEEVVGDGDAKAPIAASDVVDAEVAGQEREDARG